MTGESEIQCVSNGDSTAQWSSSPPSCKRGIFIFFSYLFVAISNCYFSLDHSDLYCKYIDVIRSGVMVR